LSVGHRIGTKSASFRVSEPVLFRRTRKSNPRSNKRSNETVRKNSMAENVMDHIVADLRTSAAKHFPDNGELKNVRIVGHTPKTDHFIYDVVVDFETRSERLAAKVYRASKSGQ